MNTKVKQRVVIGVGIFFACALLNAFFSKPPVREVEPRRAAVAVVSTENADQVASAESVSDSVPVTSVVTTTGQTNTTESDTTTVVVTAAATNTVVGMASIAITETDALSPTIEPATVVTAAIPATVTTETTTEATASADTTITDSADATTQTAAATTVDPALVTVGENVFQHTAGGVGCQLCHGADGTGLIGPNIVGKTADDIRYQFENNSRMKFITLTDQEIEAVTVYLQYLANPAAFALPGDSESSEAATTGGQASADPVLAGGQEIYQKTAGGVGCQLCHGADAKGLIGPSIVGKTADDIRTQFETNDQMKFIVLNNQEIEAVATYLQYLADPDAVALAAGAATQSETAVTAPAIDDPAVAAGEQLFQVTAGGVGCQLCHGSDATGLIGPNIVGKTADDIRFQFENNDQMKFITLTDGEIEAVAAYLQFLAAK
jgi:mono/diheme cytochrome c family protein